MPRFTAIVLRLALIVLLGGWSVAGAQPRLGLSPEAAAVYQRWLLSTCVGDELANFAAELRRHATELLPALQRALLEGPAPEEIAEVRTVAEMLYRKRAKFSFDEYEVSGVSGADIARFREVDARSFVEDQVQRFTTGYRANAVAALGLLATAPARNLLETLARNPRDPLAPAARSALATTGRPR